MLDLAKKAPIKVMLGIPAGATIEVGSAFSIFNLVAFHNPDQVWVTPQPCQGSNLELNQNELAWKAMNEGYDYLLLVETDMRFPPDSLHRLLAHGKDIAGCSYQWKEPDLYMKMLAGEQVSPRYMGHELDGKEITLDGLRSGATPRPVNFVPTGLILISTKAIRAVSDYILEQNRDEAPPGYWMPVFTKPICFPEDQPEGHKRGIIGTSDSAFCTHARDAGFEVWLDAALSLQIIHIGSNNYEAPPLPSANDK